MFITYKMPSDVDRQKDGGREASQNLTHALDLLLQTFIYGYA